MENYSGIKLARLSTIFLAVFLLAFTIGRSDIPHWLMSILFAVGIAGLISGLVLDYIQTDLVAEEMIKQNDEFEKSRETEAEAYLRFRKAYANGMIPYVAQVIYKEDSSIYPAMSIIPARNEKDAIDMLLKEMSVNFPDVSKNEIIYTHAVSMNSHEPDTINIVDLYEFYKKSRNGDKNEDPEQQFARFLSELDIKRHLVV